jgi:hypothetical protein
MTGLALRIYHATTGRRIAAWCATTAGLLLLGHHLTQGGTR